MNTQHICLECVSIKTMMPYIPYFFLLLHIFPETATTAPEPAYAATDLILLDCGASSNSNDTGGRNWEGDERSRYASSNAATITSASAAFYMDPSVFPVPYKTARIFPSPFRYNFPVTAGPKFLRLHFYPETYSGFNTVESLFSVTANEFILLRNFSAFLCSKNLSQPSFMKEFAINVNENQRLDLTFSPNPNSFAFINGIEVVSMPDTLYFRENDVQIKFVNQLYYLQNDTAMENLYRLNVGGGMVEIQDDSGPNRGMFRAWSPDHDYIIGDVGYTPHVEGLPIKYTSQTPPYSAPPIVYETSRKTSNYSLSQDWAFLVDSGFLYLFRLHFCEIMQEITQRNQEIFTISINNQIVEREADIIDWTVSNQTPIFKDYITRVEDGDGSRGKQNVRLSLKPNREAHTVYESATLNGLEIFKVSDAKKSLAAANPEVVTSPTQPPGPVSPARENRSGVSSLIYAVIGSLFGVLVVISVVILLIFRRWRKANDSGTTSKSWVLLSLPSRSSRANGSGSGASLPSSLCRYFTLNEIKKATCSFDDNFVIGEGGFGKVYKGLIDDGTTTVAIKRQKPLSSQGSQEFLTEIKMLSKLRHLNLVSLIGYCDAYGEMILVYDYMVHGTLRSHLYNSQQPPLPWNQRLQICIGAAKGLHYLHTGAEQTIIHRDVKSSNILLDEKWVAKISDFGLSKISATDHVSTVVKGSLGYVDPEYYRRRQLTEKSDVYSFGVVLLEVLCGRPAVVKSLPKEQINLAEWAEFCYLEGKIEQIVDANLNGQITPQCLNKFAEIATQCVRGTGIERPSMNDIVWSLELAVWMQKEESEGFSSREGDGHSFTKQSPSSQSSSERLKSGDVFSEMVTQFGR